MVSDHTFIQAVYAEEGFAKRYRTYQDEVNAEKTALNKKDYQTTVNHFSKAIEMSSFVTSHQKDISI
jgi:hypothetical protein